MHPRGRWGGGGCWWGRWGGDGAGGWVAGTARIKAGRPEGRARGREWREVQTRWGGGSLSGAAGIRFPLGCGSRWIINACQVGVQMPFQWGIVSASSFKIAK